MTSAERACAMGRDAGIAKHRMHREILPTLEMLGLVDLEWTQSAGEVAVVSERIPPMPELFLMADQILRVVMPEAVELIALEILRQSTAMPITVATAIDLCSSLGDEPTIMRAIDDLESLHLCSRQQSADGDVVLFNPNVWAADKDYIMMALRAEDGAARAALMALVEEVSTTAGLPENEVVSTDPRWINYAVSQGLIQRSLVKTATGQERSFLFSPHMGRSAFDAPTGTDPSGHVRQLIGSMVFANRFASNRLFSPQAFLRRLIREGEAGNASAIKSDYSMLETAGIVRVEQAQPYYKFILLQSDVAEEALTHLNVSGGDGSMAGGLREQQGYRHPERERARRRAELGRDAEPSPGATESILAALRQEAGRRRYGN
ncbi:hypothetical protein [Kribbella sp. NPDC048915]|uniref:hypothetical protein n=1 Tax=Kribbella sp. NPDC048915 TaxID=3155148 RepID=UPI0033DA4E81